MNHLQLKGAAMPALGLAAWQLSGRVCYDAMRHAPDLGCRHIDTAQIYGNESEVGRAIRDSGVSRAELFVTTKVAPGNCAATATRRSSEESLKASTKSICCSSIGRPARHRSARRWARPPSSAKRERRA